MTASAVTLRRPTLRLRRPALAAAAVCLLLLPAAPATAAAPPAAHHASAPAFSRDRTPLPAGVFRGSGATAPAASSSSGSSTGAIARMIGGLALVLAVIYGVYWLLKTVGKSRSPESDGRIQLLSSATLGSNRTLHLVRVGDDVVLVGAGEQSVTPIRAYSADELRRSGLDVDDPPSAFRPVPAEPGLARIVAELKRRTAR